jgi:hypothetical protein
VTREKGGAMAFGQEVDPDARSSLFAGFAWPTSCPLRWSRYSLMLLVKRVGKRSERVTAVFIGGGTNSKATRPTGEIALRTKGPSAASFQTFRPPRQKSLRSRPKTPG